MGVVDCGGVRTGVRGSSLGRKAELMSPMPTKNSSVIHVYLALSGHIEEEKSNLQGITFTRFGLHSQTSARSSIMTTID